MARTRLSNRIVPLVVVSMALAFALMRVQWQLEGEPKLEWRLGLHQQVLDNTAPTPYMEHMFAISHLAEALARVGVPLPASFMAIQGLGYLLAFLATHYLLAGLRRSSGATLAGLLTVAAYAGILLQYSAVQPADGFAVAALALTLALAVRERWGWVVGVSVAASVVSLKHVLVGPALLLFFALEGRWRMWPVAVAVGLAGYAWGIACPWVFGPRAHPGVVTGAVWIEQIPKALAYHASFASVPLLCLWQIGGRTGSLVLAALSIYPMLILAYGLQLQFIYELRSFWVVVPVFAAIIAHWVDER